VGSSLAIATDASTDRESAGAAATELTMISWNLHYGVDPDADVDLEQIARTIEEHSPSIVMLQEVSRGWMLGGGTDMATWLAQRLDMHVAYAPAADRQFGNAVLTNLPTAGATVTDLPYGNGPQNRSAIGVDIDLSTGPLRATSVHLQNKSHVPTRLAQIDALLGALADAPVLIVAGDFNARPGSPEIETMTAAGLVSAQDVSGDPSAMTNPSTNPDKRIDWVFGRGVTFTSTEVLADALSSDHLPLVVRFRVG
jgi:endonuclease/exonuclease/phosphatase family metal-dependent hydrolase